MLLSAGEEPGPAISYGSSSRGRGSGGNGLSREYPVEKLLRDARASMIEDGCNDILSLVGASRL
jgi:hypothetical protein